MKLGFDIGGTKTELVVLDDKNEIIFKERLFNKKILEENFENIMTLIEKSKISKINKIGFSLKAIIDPEKNIIIKSSLNWVNNKLINKIKNKYNCEIKLQNDAKCFALAESIDGAGKDYKTGFYLILGTGVGGATIINHQILSGLNNFAGEVGLIKTNNKTIYEDILSGPAFSKNYQNGSLTPQEIMTDSDSKEYFNSYMENLSDLLVIICNVIAPDVIVIGGGLSNIPNIIDELPQYLTKKIYQGQTPAVKCNLLGDSAGGIGACCL